MKFKYLKIVGDMIWGIHELSKERFVSSVQAGDLIINTEDGTYFDKDSNSWKEIEGDER